MSLAACFLLLAISTWSLGAAARGGALRASASAHLQRLEQQEERTVRLRETDGRQLAAAAVCWRGPGQDWGGVPTAGIPEGLNWTSAVDTPQGPETYIRIAGAGCRQCLVGVTCGFELRFATGELFDTPFPLLREIMVTLVGPSLVHAYTVPHVGNLRGRRGLVFSVSYKAWDAGAYSLVIQTDCARFNGTVGPRRLATLPLEILENDEIPGGGGGGQDAPYEDADLVAEISGGGPGGSGDADVAELSSLLDGPSSPCDDGLVGRWVYNESQPLSVNLGTTRPYSFQVFPCAGGELTGVDAWFEALRAQGIGEIAFVGDSHQRHLFKHLQQLINGSVDTPEEHQDLFWSYTHPPTGHNLRLTFLFLPGLFPDNYRGCRRMAKMEGWFQGYPQLPGTADVIVLDASHWSFQFCSKPEVTFALFLPQFLEWSHNQFLRLGRPNVKMLWRSSPPFPTGDLGCMGRRNSGLAWANELARSLVQRYNFTFVDFWPVEAARYGDTCKYQKIHHYFAKDSHYSCELNHHRNMHGDVGEVVTRLFMRAVTFL